MISEELFYHLACNYINLHELIQLSLSCDKYNKYYLNLINNPQIAEKHAVHKNDTQQLFEKIRTDNPLLVCNNNSRIFDLMLACNISKWAEYKKYTLDEYNIVKNYFKNNNIAKHAGLFGDYSYKPENAIEKRFFSRGLIKSGYQNIQFVDKEVYIKCVKYNRLDIIKEHPNHFTISAFYLATCFKSNFIKGPFEPEKYTELQNYLKNLEVTKKFIIQASEPHQMGRDEIVHCCSRSIRINYLISAGRFAEVDSIIMKKDITSIRFGLAPKYLEHLIETENDFHEHINEYLSLLIVIRGKNKNVQNYHFVI